MCNACNSKEYELIHLHKEVARLITENHFLNQEVDDLLANNNVYRGTINDLHQAVVAANQQQIQRQTGVM